MNKKEVMQIIILVKTTFESFLFGASHRNSHFFQGRGLYEANVIMY